MATTSTVVTVKNQLVTLLSAALSGVQVSYFYPGVDDVNHESVYFGKTNNGSHEWIALRAGRKPRDEAYGLDLHIDVFIESGSVAQAETRALELFAAVQDTIANDPHIGLGAASQITASVGEWSLDPGYNDQGEGVQLIVSIEISARLR